MFIGHYGPAFAGKAAAKTVPLWVLFVAVQLLDYGWSVLVLLGVEKVRIVPGFMPMSPFDLFYMPYTHSLLGAAIWAVAAGALYALAPRRQRRLVVCERGRAGGVLALAPGLDRPQVRHAPRLRKRRAETRLRPCGRISPSPLALEIALFLGGLVLYVRATTAKGALGRVMPFVCAIVFVGAELIDVFGPPPPNPNAAATLILIIFTVGALVAYALERTRQPRA